MNNLQIIPIYRIDQNTHRGDFPNKKVKWYLDGQKARSYVEKFEERTKNVKIHGHGGPIYAKLTEEYALFDVSSGRYYSLGAALKLEE